MKLLLWLSLFSPFFAVASTAVAPNISDKCKEQFAHSRFLKKDMVASLCEQMKLIPQCRSVDGTQIGHIDRLGTNPSGKRILVFGQIHGDELNAGELALMWAERVQAFQPRNSWRFVPRLNPDGAGLFTRMNKNGVDLNRNFPTNDWNAMALSEWKKRTHSNPRRFPGKSGGSEPETRCALDQIRDFNPDVVVSIHTPYGVLDFDGPKDKRFKFGALPWRSLGTFPGSLGRYLWIERQIPVLTIELSPRSLDNNASEFALLEDKISFLARPSVRPDSVASTKSAH